MKYFLLALFSLWAAGMIWVAYEFVTHVPQGTLDCTIQMGREGCEK